jgi:hypothetical protein
MTGDRAGNGVDMTAEKTKKQSRLDVAKLLVVSGRIRLATFAFAIVAQAFPAIGPARSAEPNTSLHYASGRNSLNGPYDRSVARFNLADVGYVRQLNGLPSSVKGLVYLGMTNGIDATFEAAVSAYISNRSPMASISLTNRTRAPPQLRT